MIDPLCVEKRGPPFDAVNGIALIDQKLGQVGAILTGNAGDQCLFLQW